MLNQRPHLTLQSSIDAPFAYSVLHITGYTKVWPQAALAASHHHSQQQSGGYGVDADTASSAATTNFHLIAIARVQASSAPTSGEANSGGLASSSSAAFGSCSSPLSSSPFEFVTRHDASGHMTFVDERVTALLGYKSSDMLGKSLHELAASGEQAALVAEQLKYVVDNKQAQPPVLFNWHATGASATGTPGGEIVLKCKTSAYAFLNPCNDAFEFVVCTHTCQPTQQTLSTVPASASSVLTNATNNLNNNNNNNNSDTTSTSIYNHSHYSSQQYGANSNPYATTTAPGNSYIMQQQQQQQPSGIVDDSNAYRSATNAVSSSSSSSSSSSTSVVNNGSNNSSAVNANMVWSTGSAANLTHPYG